LAKQNNSKGHYYKTRAKQMGINLQGISGKLSSSQAKKTTGASSKKGGPTTSSAPVGAGDSINLTDAASLIQKAEAALEAVPIVNSELVDDVSRRVSSGQYVVSDEKIADKIIELEKNLS
jgi:flagellar biosynthesis anti-sigma factor FlgM